MSPTDTLPELTDDTVDRMESAVFARIAEDRTRDASRSRKRRTGVWIGLGSAAAVVAIAAVIAPSVGGLVNPSSAGSTADQPAIDPAVGGGMAEPEVAREGGGDASSTTGLTATDQAAAAPDADRDIIASASAAVLVGDLADSADEIAALAEGYAGYVESMNVGTDGDGVTPLVEDGSIMYPQPSGPGYGSVTIRVPAEDLNAAIDDLDNVGEVTSVSINRSDVTDQAIDLRARVEATQASVDRLTQLMAQSASVSDLIAAEVALSDRQALLESYEQQLAQLESQVAMSTLSVSLTTATEPVEADPAGFGDGITAGWNALVATLNGVVIALGFLIPWIVVVALAALIVWGIVRLVRRRRAAKRAASATSATARSAAKDDPEGQRRSS
ncbi:MAG TPA: DUF4349 domain-containing protein [Microbacterium sp.]|uniref:DUF4349 domain-containing protein n=1 Tax=Microbacterium sp. TaxID=51671 RepID=UPI002C3CFB49|nr:DUF4349 domain-containing protein [Microbacterium sp.]HWI30137.1 DUF4349 domain-containing protein [Microbacterium sp.]